MENNQKVSFLEKCAYGVGDMACNLFWGLICMATAFYTEYFGMAAAAAGTMIMLVSFIDIAFDVIVGAVADRKQTRWGRFRPWILYGVIPFCVIGFFTFYTPDFGRTAKIVYAYITFLGFRLMYSVVNVPYGALMGVISADPAERTSVSAYRNVLAQCGCLLSYGFVFTFVKLFKDNLGCSEPAAFSWTAFTYAVAAFFLLMFTFFFTRERVEPVKKEQTNLKDDLKDLVSNKPWIALSVAGIAMLFFSYVHNGLVPYYAKYCLAESEVHQTAVIKEIKTETTKGGDVRPFAYVLDNGAIDTLKNPFKVTYVEDGKQVTKGTERAYKAKDVNGNWVSLKDARGNGSDEDIEPVVGDQVSYFTFEVTGSLFGMKLSWELVSTLFLGLGTIVTIIGTLLIQVVVKRFGKKKTWLGCFALASLFSLCFLFVGKNSIGTVIVLNILFTLALGPSGFIMWSMYADVADNAEVETGRRATGLIYSSATMAQKLGTALANAVPAFSLAAIGFAANSFLSESTIASMGTAFAVIPLIGAVIGIAALYFYKIDEDLVKKNAEILKIRRKESGDAE